MKHRIDPKIDCVFKRLLGSEQNRNLLIHFLNAILADELPAPITDVDILDPHVEKEFVDDKLSVVDVNARDGESRIFQVEIQMLNLRRLPARILYNWADIYAGQLASGEDYSLLRPTYSIWLLAENLIPGDGCYARHYKFRDEQGRTLIEHGGVWLLELEKFAAERIETEEQRWLKLFKDGETLDDAALPEWMNTDEMRQAMTTLRQFSEKERDYFAYQARQNFLREQRMIQKDLEAERQGRAQAERGWAQAEQALKEERVESAELRAENERLRALLEQRGSGG